MQEKAIIRTVACALSCCFPMLSAALPPASASDGWRSYEVYQPTITRHAVIDARTHAHKYNHCSTIAWYQDRWFCLWGSHVPVGEHSPGQRMVFSTSRDARTWTPIERLFSNDEYCENPVRYPEGKGHQWQPNLGVVDGELWVLWNHGGSVHDFTQPDGTRSKDLRGLYFSRLKRADGKWVNRRLEWDRQIWPRVDGKQYYMASTQNLYRLRSGRVLAPVTLWEGRQKAEDAPPENVSGWWAAEKRNAVIYTDDLGKTWRLSSTCQTPGFSWIQWEPTVWEQPDGSVMMFARHNNNWALGHPKPTSGQFLLWSISRDGGETWSPHRYVPLESVCSRMHVAPLDGRGVWEPAKSNDDFTGRRLVMVHNDAPGSVYPWGTARTNLALFFTRGGGLDFVAGNNISEHQPRVCYPQMWRRDDTLAISYTSSEPDSRSIYVALVSPLPKPDRYYLFPRFNDVPRLARPERDGSAWAFHGGQHVAMRKAVDPGKDGFSFGAWVRDRGTGMILDTRGAGGGFNVMIESKSIGDEGSGTQRRPAVCMLTKPHVFGPALYLTPQGAWHYLGLTADNRTGEAVFYVDGRTETVRFEAPVPRSLKGAAPHVGAKSLPGSMVPGLTGDIRFAALYAGAELGPDHHRWLHNRFAEELGRPRLDAATEPSGSPVMWMDPADEAAFERDFVVPTAEPRGGSEVVAIDGRRVLRLRDHGSVGVDLDENDRQRGDRVFLRFRFRIECGDGQTLCTVGDFSQPARLIARDGRAFLCTSKTETPCGHVNPEGWTTVSIETYRDVTRACIGEGSPVEVHHKPEATWAYLGEAFPKYNDFPGARFLIDVEAVETRVESKSP
ncbi:MAG TPA: sialidase family protein [Thermoguttaceae bacterium]|nr:sialidase family protein [Thermoguttaceae bacterium]